MFIWSRRVMLAALAGAFHVAASHAQETPMSTGGPGPAQVIPVEDAVGLWRVSTRSGSGVCLIALGRMPRVDGYGVETGPCSLPLFAKVVAWRPADGGFELQSQDGLSLICFRQTGVDAFVATDEAYRMERATLS